MASPSPAPVQVRVLDRIRISPPLPSEAAAQAQPITFFDAAWVFTGPVECLYFFRHPHPASTLPLLRSSLSHALRRFYPLAGTLRPSVHTPDAPFLYSYTDADALPFLIAESDGCPDDFDHLVGTSPRDLRKMRPLVPELPAPGEDGAFALAAVQATAFPGHGLCLGVSIHHAACDNASAMHFVRTWAAACRRRLGSGMDDSQAALPPPPVLDRSLVADTNDLREKTLAAVRPPLASETSPPPPPPQETLVVASFLLTRDQIDRIKGAAARAAGPGAHISAFVAASAFAWVCLLKSRSVGVEGAARSHMIFSMECRSRLTPPLPAEYFGNCVRPCFVEAATEELCGAGGVALAAVAIGRAVQEVEWDVLEGAAVWMERVRSVLPERPMSVVGSPRYGVYDIDFGWGRPARVEIVNLEKTPGTVALAKSFDGDGGIEVGVVLPPEAMETFASSFTDGDETCIRSSL